MAKLSEAAKAAMTIAIGGREYRLSPLELSDLGELERWVETLPFERLGRQIDTLGDHLTPETREKLILEAKEEAKAITLDSPEFVRRLASIEGTVYMLWLSLRRAHPEITRDEVGRLVSINSLEEWQQRLDKVSGLSGDGDADPTESAANQSSLTKPESTEP